MPARLKPRQPQRWKWFSWAGGILRGIFAHARVFQGDVATAGDVAEMTLTEDLQLRVSDMAAMLAALGAGGGVKFSPVYFTATYFDADELTVTGLPDVPEDVQWVGVIEWRTTGELYWFQPAHHITYDPATNRIQVAGATFGGALSQYMAIYVTEQNAYNQVLNAIQQVMVNAIQYDWVDVTTPITAGNFATTNPQDTGWMIGKGQKWIGVEVTWTTLGANTLTITQFVDNTDTGIVEHQMVRGDYAYPNGAIGGVVALDANGFTLAQAGAGTIYRIFYIKIQATNRFKLKFSAATATGTITVRVTEQG